MRYDLNLLRAFDALYQEQNVSRAAQSIGLSQPAMSAALSKLRTLFNDPLFIRQRYGVVPTEKAQSLHKGIAEALANLDEVVRQEQQFDPARSTQKIEIAANDYFELLFVPTLLSRLRSEAPHIQLSISTLAQDVRETGVMSGQTQLAFGRLSDPPDNLIMREAVHEKLACLVSDTPSNHRTRLTVSDYQEAKHVVVKPSQHLKTGIFQLLEQHKIHRKIVCEVTRFHAVADLITNSNLIATLPRAVCQHLALQSGLKMLPMPIEVGTFPFHLAWHRRYQKDPAHKWLREIVLDCCQKHALTT